MPQAKREGWGCFEGIHARYFLKHGHVGSYKRESVCVEALVEALPPATCCNDGGGGGGGGGGRGHMCVGRGGCTGHVPQTPLGVVTTTGRVPARSP
jgi:hypothetical protein